MDWDQPDGYASDEMVTSIENFVVEDQSNTPKPKHDIELDALEVDAPNILGNYLEENNSNDNNSSSALKLSAKHSFEELPVIDAETIKDEQDHSNHEIESIQKEIIHKLNYNRDELITKHYGVQQPDDVLLNEVLDHFRKKKETEMVTLNKTDEAFTGEKISKTELTPSPSADPPQKIKDNNLHQKSFKNFTRASQNLEAQKNLLPRNSIRGVPSQSIKDPKGQLHKHKPGDTKTEQGKGSVQNSKFSSQKVVAPDQSKSKAQAQQSTNRNFAKNSVPNSKSEMQSQKNIQNKSKKEDAVTSNFSSFHPSKNRAPQTARESIKGRIEPQVKPALQKKASDSNNILTAEGYTVQGLLEEIQSTLRRLTEEVNSAREETRQLMCSRNKTHSASEISNILENHPKLQEEELSKLKIEVVASTSTNKENKV